MNPRRTVSILALLSCAAFIGAACDDGEEVPEDTGTGLGGEGTIGCESDVDCQASTQLCDLERQACVDCLIASHCGAGQACVQNECVATTCESSLECPIGQVCDIDLRRCVECTIANDCAEGSVCVATRCTTPCDSDIDCTPSGQVCNLEAGGCLDCVRSEDCPEGLSCDDFGMCVAGSGGDGDGDGDAGDGDGDAGDGDGDGSGGVSSGGASGDGDGDGSGGCKPEVQILVQRSGSMFEFPESGDVKWWDAVSEALDGAGDDILDQYSGSLDLSVSTFSMTGDQCPIINSSSSPLGPDELSEFMMAEQASHTPESDAPLPEAISQAVSAFAGTEDRHIVLVVSGNPDSCEVQDNVCSIDPTIDALQAAVAAGVSTKVLYLDSFDPAEGYPKAIANAGVGEPVGDLTSALENEGCSFDDGNYATEGGGAAFEAPAAPGQVRGSLQTLLDSIGSCQ